MANGSNAVTLISSSNETTILLSNIDPLLSRSSTPSSTQYSTPLTTNPLRRKRRHPIDSQDETESSTRSKRLDTHTPIERVVAIMEQLVESRRGSLHTAVLKLQQDYSNRLIDEHIDMALVLLENEVKATIFSGLLPGEIRDRWLERNAEVQLINLEGDII